MAKIKKTFEEMITELEEIIVVLERGEQPLEEMIKLYNRGIELTELCRNKLIIAEDTINNEENSIEKELRSIGK